MLWWLWLSEVRSRCSCTIYLASGNCRTSSIPSSPPSAVGCPVTHPTAPNTRLSVDNTSEELVSGTGAPTVLRGQPHSPNLVEGKVCELPLCGVLRSSSFQKVKRGARV